MITSSLFGAVTDAGEEDQLALDLAEIFAWDVDFNTELQKGDSFRVAVEKLYLDGQLRALRAASCPPSSCAASACCAPCASTGETAPATTTPDGTPLRKAFLRSPLQVQPHQLAASRTRASIPS